MMQSWSELHCVYIYRERERNQEIAIPLFLLLFREPGGKDESVASGDHPAVLHHVLLQLPTPHWAQVIEGTQGA